MKSIFIITVCFAISNLGYAQTANDAPIAESEAITVSLNDSGAHNYSFEHSQSAIAQLRKHIAKNIQYPDVMFEYGIEGTAVLEVTISDNGKIQESKIVRSISPAFDAAIVNTMESINSINIKEKKYEGANKVHVPIKFSISN